MKFIIVANRAYADLARQLTRVLSMRREYTASYWSVADYKANEAQLDGKQPVIFIGDNELSRPLVDVLPERLRGYGTACFHGGAVAILRADTPGNVSAEDLAELKAAIEDSELEVKQRSATAGDDKPADTLGLGLLAALYFVPLAFPAAAIGLLLGKFGGLKAKEREYHQLQYKYLITRFLADEFDDYAANTGGL